MSDRQPDLPETTQTAPDVHSVDVDPSVDRVLWPDPRPETLALFEELLAERPEPLRMYDQIHMRLDDLARHVERFAVQARGKRVIVVGDSDGVALTLAIGAHRGMWPGPKEVVLCDFDERVLASVEKATANAGADGAIETHLYNVFDPLPAELQGRFDVFHTNPPYGRYNRGQSILAFVERGLAACRPNAGGIVILGNDPRHPWTHRVLRFVLRGLLEKEVVPVRVMQRVHRYLLDDDPDLESGLILCTNVTPQFATNPNAPLPGWFRTKFYGRQTIDIPSHISLDGVPIQLRMPLD